ncbi:hypothetical protein [Cytobacillus oceanisediminis]|uniref:hypothetical protein n=1 Tax=Cytobacillus oceanisediminis TaxID=665099 RepID=UPI0037359449
MREEDLKLIEQYFKLEQTFSAESEPFTLITELIAEIRRQDAELDKLTALNRHYLHHFFNGDFNKMEATFKYLKMN